MTSDDAVSCTCKLAETASPVPHGLLNSGSFDRRGARAESDHRDEHRLPLLGHTSSTRIFPLRRRGEEEEREARKMARVVEEGRPSL